MTREELKEIFKILANVYPQFDVTSEKLDIWHRFLKNQNPAKVMQKAERFVLESKFPPTISDLIEVGQLREDKESVIATFWSDGN